MSEHGKLRWQCRRGMKELDELLLGFLERHYAAASSHERQAFDELLALQDLTLWRYLSGQETPADSAAAAVVRKIVARS